MGFRIDVTYLSRLSVSQLAQLADVADRAVIRLGMVIEGRPDPEPWPTDHVLNFYTTVVNDPMLMSIVSGSYTRTSHVSQRWHRQLDLARLTYNRCSRGTRVHVTKIRRAQKTLSTAAVRLTEVAQALTAFAKKCHSPAWV